MFSRYNYQNPQHLVGVERGPSVALPLFICEADQLTYLPLMVAAHILDRLKPSITSLNLSWSLGLGLVGLRALVQGLMETKWPVWKLTELKWSWCGLGGVSEYSHSLVSLSCLVLR